MLKSVSIYLSIVGILAASLLVWHLRQTPPTPPPLVQPARNPYEKTVAASGIVEAVNENINIGVPAAGLVMELMVKVWDKVEKDQPLFRLDDRDLRAQLGVYQANVKTAEATLARLKDQLARLKSVTDPRAVSADEIQTRENDVRVAEAQLEAARAWTESTQQLIDRLTIRAPRAGTILQCNIRPGEYVMLAPKDPAIVLGDLERLQVRAQVDEENAFRVRRGQMATAYLKGDTEQPIFLQFQRIEPFVVPKQSLTGSSNERVDTRVLYVIFTFVQPRERPVYVGQQMDVFIRNE